MGSFATIEDYYTFRGLVYPPTSGPLTEAEILAADAALARATDAVRGYLRLARFPRRTDGLPQSETQRDALIRATCAQLEWFEEHGNDFTGAGSQWDSVSLLEVSFSRRAGSSGATTSAGGSRQAPEAQLILRNAGFFSTRVNHPGGFF